MKNCLLMLVACAALGAAMEGFHTSQQHIEGQYLIRLQEQHFTTNKQIQDFSDMLKRRFNINIVRSFELGNVKLLFVKGEHENVMKAESLSSIKYIERNMVHHVAQQCEEQTANGCWGLDRIDQREALPYDDVTDPSATYIWGADIGEGVVAYVADTGIDVTHPEFEGRATHGYTAGEIPNDEDVNGHGTHCAGTIGSNAYGVAKGTSLVAVKVLRDSGFGSTTGIVDGLEWILNDHNERSDALGSMAKSVINLSLGGGANQAMDDAVAALVAGGAIAVVAGGNSDADACNFSPARTPEALTIGATSVDDTTWRATNYGDCIDIFAPGDGILSTLPGGTTGVYSGTSMATPHVAGVVARYQSSLDQAPTPQEVEDHIKSGATEGAITFQPGHHGVNMLLYDEC